MKIRLSKYDKLWSKLVRERDRKCRKLGCNKQSPWVLNAHHIRPRGRKSTRLLLENGITLCFAHHTGTDDSVHRRGDQFIVEIIGKREFNRLEKLSLKIKTEREAITEFKEFLSTKNLAELSTC